MANNKVKCIIKEEFDERMGLAVISYLCDQVGFETAGKITDEQIAKIEGNALMTAPFCQSMVRCARRIARECSFVNDVIPYLIDDWGHLGSGITKDRAVDILVAYIDNDLSTADPGYVRDTLRDVCGCDYFELEDMGIASWLDFDEEDE